MGGTARQFNNMYIKYKKKFKKPIYNVAQIINYNFTDDEFVESFKELYPYLWEDLNQQYKYWHDKNAYIIKKGKKSRYNFRKPYNFIMDCSYHIRKKMRKEKSDDMASSDEDIRKLYYEIKNESKRKIEKIQREKTENLKYMQEINPSYGKLYIAKYFKEHDLHVKLEIIRELSKYKSKDIISFFYKVNACTRNFSLKQESMKYIQKLSLPFVLRRKKKGKKNFIDNEIVKNNSSPEELLQRLYVDNLEKYKKFDVFISHNSLDEDSVVDIFKIFNKKGYVAYIDWVNDKFDLKRQWCNATTSKVIRERIKQSKFLVLIFSENVLKSQWCGWEIGYADALGKKICILNLKEEKNIPQFYISYPKLNIYNDEFWIENNGNEIKLEDWIETKNIDIHK